MYWERAWKHAHLAALLGAPQPGTESYSDDTEPVYIRVRRITILRRKLPICDERAKNDDGVYFVDRGLAPAFYAAGLGAVYGLLFATFVYGVFVIPAQYGMLTVGPAELALTAPWLLPVAWLGYVALSRSDSTSVHISSGDRIVAERRWPGGIIRRSELSKARRLLRVVMVFERFDRSVRIRSSHVPREETIPVPALLLVTDEQVVLLRALDRPDDEAPADGESAQLPTVKELVAYRNELAKKYGLPVSDAAAILSVPATPVPLPLPIASWLDRGDRLPNG